MFIVIFVCFVMRNLKRFVYILGIDVKFCISYGCFFILFFYIYCLFFCCLVYVFRFFWCIIVCLFFFWNVVFVFFNFWRMILSSYVILFEICVSERSFIEGMEGSWKVFVRSEIDDVFFVWMCRMVGGVGGFVGKRVGKEISLGWRVGLGEICFFGCMKGKILRVWWVFFFV